MAAFDAMLNQWLLQTKTIHIQAILGKHRKGMNLGTEYGETLMLRSHYLCFLANFVCLIWSQN